MFRRSTTPTETQQPVQAVERITSVLGSGVVWHGSINGSGGVRIEGAFEGEIALRGMLVVGETGRVTCQNVRANAVIVAGFCAVRFGWKKQSNWTSSLLPKPHPPKRLKPSPLLRRQLSYQNLFQRGRQEKFREREKKDRPHP